MKGKRFTKELKAVTIKQVLDRGYSVRAVSRRLGVSDKSMYFCLLQTGDFSKTIKMVYLR